MSITFECKKPTDLSAAALLARKADVSLYVLRSGGAQVSHILDSLQFLGASGCPMMGCVLNGVQEAWSGYGYGLGYRYGCGYGKYSYRRKKEES